MKGSDSRKYFPCSFTKGAPIGNYVGMGAHYKGGLILLSFLKNFKNCLRCKMYIIMFLNLKGNSYKVFDYNDKKMWKPVLI